MEERKGFQPFIQVFGAGVGEHVQRQWTGTRCKFAIRHALFGAEIYGWVVELSWNGRAAVPLEARRSSDRSTK